MIKRALPLLFAFAFLAMTAACQPLPADGVSSIAPTPPDINSNAAAGSVGIATPAPSTSVNDTDISIQPMVFQPADAIASEISVSLSGFSLDLFRRVVDRDAGENVFVSPLSVWLALCMTYNGASGTTAEGMANALHTVGIPLEDLNRDNAGLMGVLMTADPNVQIAIANSIWLRQGFAVAVNADFLDRNRKFYAAGIEALDFSDPDSAGMINGWVEDHTNGNIRDLIERPIDPDTVMFLINAVHFNAPWQVAFDPEETRDGVFHTGDGNKTDARYLHRVKRIAGFVGGDVVAARIPYASGRLEMVAILPKQQKLSSFVKNLTTEQLDSYILKCGESSSELLFPVFKAEYKAELSGILNQMGMEIAFDEANADFSAISDGVRGNLFISEVNHKTFIEVNEKGTEASAATSVEIKARSVPQELIFNKPFLYLIRDTVTGAILFMGTMENPSFAE